MWPWGEKKEGQSDRCVLHCIPSQWEQVLLIVQRDHDRYDRLPVHFNGFTCSRIMRKIVPEYCQTSVNVNRRFPLFCIGIIEKCSAVPGKANSALPVFISFRLSRPKNMFAGRDPMEYNRFHQVISFRVNGSECFCYGHPRSESVLPRIF